MYAIVDIETTGGIAADSGITEIAVILHDGGAETGRFHTLINPLRPIPRFITSLTGISNAMVSGAPCFAEIAGALHEVLEGRVFVAHNVSFDHSFLDYALRQQGYRLTRDKACTVQLSRRFFPGLPSYSLGRLCSSLGIPLEDRHRALGDAQATSILFEKLLSRGAAQEIGKKLKRAGRIA